MTESPRDERLRFSIVDVFTSKPLTGNPLAVVPDAEALRKTAMQRIAREFNQSETTFLLPPRRPGADWRLRSFTPSGAEVFGAGHNALGAWWWLADAGRLRLNAPRQAFAQEIGERVLPVEIVSDDKHRVVAVAMTQARPSLGAVYEDRSALAEALGLTEKDLVVDRLLAQIVSTGAPHLLVPCETRAAVHRARPHPERLLSILRATEGQGCYLYCLDPLDSAAAAHARFFNPTVGIFEDPATGSAAGPLGYYLVARGIFESSSTLVVEQGHTMGRASRIQVSVREGIVQITGAAVVVADGTLRRPQ